MVGTVSLRLQVDGASGAVRDLAWLANTLEAQHDGVGGAGWPWVTVDAALLAIAEQLWELRLPPSPDGGDTAITVPFVFQ